jgi:hypothetical protein
MDACSKRLGIALLIVAVTIGLNTYAVVSGFADNFYSRLLQPASDDSQVADVRHRKQKSPGDLKPGCTRLVEYAFRTWPGYPDASASCKNQALIRI